MKTIDFLKKYWFIISVILVAAFVIGDYHKTINYMEQSVNKNTSSVSILEKKMAVLTAILQKDYPNIKVSAYMKEAIKNKIPPNAIASGLNILKKKNPQLGKMYLQEYMKFNHKQASSVYKPQKDKQH